MTSRLWLIVYRQFDRLYLKILSRSFFNLPVALQL